MIIDTDRFKFYNLKQKEIILIREALTIITKQEIILSEMKTDTLISQLIGDK